MTLAASSALKLSARRQCPHMVLHRRHPLRRTLVGDFSFRRRAETRQAVRLGDRLIGLHAAPLAAARTVLRKCAGRMTLAPFLRRAHHLHETFEAQIFRSQILGKYSCGRI